MFSRVQEWWLRRKVAKARKENNALRVALGLVNRWITVRKSRRARRVKPLQYQGKPRMDTNGHELSNTQRAKLLLLWLITCDVRHYREFQVSGFKFQEGRRA